MVADGYSAGGFAKSSGVPFYRDVQGMNDGIVAGFEPRHDAANTTPTFD